MRLDKAAVVDLYSGVGGMTRGFRDEGLRVVAGVDIDPTCRFPYETNNPGSAFVAADLSRAHVVDIGSLFPKGSVRVLIGCAPCQPFSRYSNTRRTSDDKWRLLYAFSRVIKDTQPVVVSMENVPDLARHRVFRDFLASLDREGYFIDWGVVDAADYGVPQTRRRLVLLASALGPIELIPAPRRHKRKTVRDAIGHLDPIDAGAASPKDRLHRSSALTDLNIQRIRCTPEGGGWRDWPDKLKLACHRKKSGASFPSVYGRMCWDEPAPTLTTQCHGLGNGRFGHPDQDRAISLREAALLQTFPASYRFVPADAPIEIGTVARHIGNAVPVRLARAIARSIKLHLAEL